jgi:serine/threonine protein kinase
VSLQSARHEARPDSRNQVLRRAFDERFEREALAIAALNHPHICTLHDVGPKYLVMEFIEGPTLVGPLPLAEALLIARTGLGETGASSSSRPEASRYESNRAANTSSSTARSASSVHLTILHLTIHRI